MSSNTEITCMVSTFCLPCTCTHLPLAVMFAVFTHNAVYSFSWYVNYVYLQDNHTALMFAALKGHTDVVQVLLSRQDVDINMRDKVCPSQWN